MKVGLQIGSSGSVISEMGRTKQQEEKLWTNTAQPVIKKYLGLTGTSTSKTSTMEYNLLSTSVMNKR